VLFKALGARVGGSEIVRYSLELKTWMEVSLAFRRDISRVRSELGKFAACKLSRAESVFAKPKNTQKKMPCAHRPMSLGSLVSRACSIGTISAQHYSASFDAPRSRQRSKTPHWDVVIPVCSPHVTTISRRVDRKVLDRTLGRTTTGSGAGCSYSKSCGFLQVRPP
jgi:hypothetical protein